MNLCFIKTILQGLVIVNKRQRYQRFDFLFSFFSILHLPFFGSFSFFFYKFVRALCICLCVSRDVFPDKSEAFKVKSPEGVSKRERRKKKKTSGSGWREANKSWGNLFFLEKSLLFLKLILSRRNFIIIVKVIRSLTGIAS